MAQYEIKTIEEKINIVKLSETEYDALHNVFLRALADKELDRYMPTSRMDRMVLTDGYRRIEFQIEIG